MRVLLMASAITGAITAASAQVFEVASVKPNRSGTTSVSMRMQPGGRFNALNVTVRDLIRFAYAVQPFQIEGGPRGLDSDRFDVDGQGGRRDSRRCPRDRWVPSS